MLKISKTGFYLILAVLALWGCNSGGRDGLSTDVINNPNSASGKSDGSLPIIEFEKDIYDFGKVIQGEIVTYGFKFKNTGNADLVISQVKTSCGCTVPKFPKEAIKPGEEKVLSVTFNSEGRNGVQNKTVTVVSNCQPNTNIIRIKAQVLIP
jgi:hypothetical protein